MMKIANQLTEIRNFLKEKSNNKVKESGGKFVPTSKKVYGVYLAEINKIVSKYTSGGFKLVEELWKSDYLEERILAAKILGKICKKDPEKTLELIRKFVDDIVDWATCDTLAIQGIRPIAKIKQKEIFELSKKLVKSKNPWKRRFGIVLLINFKKDKTLKQEIKTIIKQVENDKEYYVKKAISWIKREIK
ncbi:MAG: DNA alkylation repair protein [Candidatus Aenigmarchaeota archaeon]|nr:DNA alkylation repair protein [Candidatus Aenigmarchaeota archaeon]